MGNTAAKSAAKSAANSGPDSVTHAGRSKKSSGTPAPEEAKGKSDLRKKKNRHETGSVSSKTSRSSKHTRSGKSSSSSKQGKKETKNERLVREGWCEATASRNIETCRQFCHADAICLFTGADTAMKLPEFLATCYLLLKSFPNNSMSWDSIKEESPGVVHITNYRGRGTHTGDPYSFGPYPPIAATGIVVNEDPCDVTITVKKGKMTKLEIALRPGALSGPPGYYHKIGGDLTFVPP